MNKVILIGRLTKDVECHYSANQTALARFTLAVTRPTKNKEADFPSIVAFGKTAELIETHLKKGSPVLIEGTIQTGNYEGKDGNKIYTTDVIAQRVKFLPSTGGKKESDDIVPESMSDTFEAIDDEAPF